MRIPKPATVEEAREIALGALVTVFWPGDYNKWFRAEVVSVDNDVEEEGQDGQMHVNPDKFYCLLRYLPMHGWDVDDVDTEWDEVFDSDDSVVLELGPGGRRAFQNFIPPQAAEVEARLPAFLSPQKARDAAIGERASAAEAAAGVATALAAAAPRNGTSKRAAGNSQKRAAAVKLEPPDLSSRPARHQQGAMPPISQQQQQQRAEGRNSRRGSKRQQQGSQQAGPSQPPAFTAGDESGGNDDDDDGDENYSEPHAKRPRGTQKQGRPRKTARAKPDYSRVPDPAGAPAAGVVKRLELVDFMCHPHLAMDFGPNINLLAGINGSGKSAVLQALQCGLGARAAETGRYKVMKAFVRKGEAQAVVKVTLWNTGPDAYKRSLLGPELTVVRKINATSGGATEVLDCQGRPALRGAQAVAELIDELSIDATNPAIVLTQDMARSFAGERSEKDKYQVFMEATQFERTLQNLQQANTHVSEMQAQLHENEESLDALEKDTETKQQLLEQLREVGAWHAHLEQLLKCLAWAPVETLETAIAKLREASNDTYPATLQAHEAQVASYQKQHAGIEKQQDEQQRRLQEVGASAQGRQEELSRLQEQVKAKKRAALQAQRNVRRQKEALEAAQEEQAALQEASREVDADFMRSTQEQAAGHRLRVAQCRGDCERAGVAVSNARQYRAEREAAAALERAVVLEAERQLADANRRVHELEKDLRRLQASQAAPLAKFGGHGAVELDAAVKAAVRQGRFRHPPLLIGSQLALSDDRWALAVEAAIGRQLSQWVVDNMSDATTIKGLCSRLQQPPQGFSVVVMSFSHPLHLIPQDQQPPQEVMTCLRALRFPRGENAQVVQNVLIDHANIERTVLTHTQTEAKAHARDHAFWQRYRIVGAYAKDGSKAYRRNTTVTTLPPDARMSRPRLVRDLSQQVDECAAELADAREAVRGLQADVRRKQEAASAAMRELQGAVQAYKASTQQKQTLDTQYQQVISQQPLELAGGDGGEAAQRLAQLGNQVFDAQVQLEIAEDALKVEQQELEALQQRLAQARAEPLQAAAEVEAVQEAILELAAEKEAVGGQLEGAQQAAAHARRQLALVQAKLAEAESHYEGTLRNAGLVCSREEAEAMRAQLVADWKQEGKSEEAISGLLQQDSMLRQQKQVETKIQRRERSAQVSFDDLEAQVAQQTNKLKKLRLKQQEARVIFEECLEGWSVRRRKFKELRSNVATNLSKSFQRYLGYHKHRGAIDVDYKEKELVFKVGIGGTEPTTDMRALSGGERSLASLAFILALGHVGINPPFHALDEFDVFMDAVNRRLAMAFLLEFAHRNPERQIILLTPGDVSAVDEVKAQVSKAVKSSLPADFVRIQRMKPPRGHRQQQQQQQQES
ncbi:hypothetical protein D9Q98_004505 [Chlorella vulgaris]|uniref:RecF/RecN/SMC N-terminal domain-containing protein n=1 Tax=Chlorella vulgaris TaxID=3077 RepID=A0A9D4TQ03_CHLVU|nr:hypothetical protein D9Q98_004505 [Chlorella vulgaris]